MLCPGEIHWTAGAGGIIKIPSASNTKFDVANGKAATRPKRVQRQRPSQVKAIYRSSVERQLPVTAMLYTSSSENPHASPFTVKLATAEIHQRKRERERICAVSGVLFFPGSAAGKLRRQSTGADPIASVVESIMTK